MVAKVLSSLRHGGLKGNSEDEVTRARPELCDMGSWGELMFRNEFNQLCVGCC